VQTQNFPAFEVLSLLQHHARQETL
jgi:hypothetical protein